MSRITVSAVREILKITEQPEIISFAGGMPAPELFPVEAFARAHAEVFAEEGRAAMQYSTTEGWRPLREWIARRMSSKGIAADADRVLITAGSQQGIDLVARVFLNPGDAVVVENPTYLAAIQAFSAFEARLVAVGSDDLGMCVDEVEQVLKHSQAKLIYNVSSFQNPKGTTLSRERRERLIDISSRYGVPILEDDPYGELRYTGESVEPLAAMDRDGMVVYLSTFSKTISPGMRVGWAVASEEIIRALVIAKQAADLHTNTIEQRAAAKMLVDFDYDGHVEKLCAVYGERLKVMLAAIERHFPAGARWTRPEGGLFVWAELPAGIRGDDLLRDALNEKVAFVPGAPYFPCDERHNFIRLNFSNQQPEMIEEGIRRIGKILERRMNEKL